MASAVISWTNKDVESICPECGVRYLDADNYTQFRTIDTTQNTNCPESLRAIWTKDDYAEMLYTVGFPPKCCYCGFYILGYTVLCLKESKRNKHKDCGCRKCKPFLYKNQRRS